MSPSQIEGVKENINFLTRVMMAYIAGVYLLAGAVGKFVMEWLMRDELVWSEFGIVPTVATVCMVILMAEVVRLQRKVRRFLGLLGVKS